jgi:hypothetical protein
MELKEILRQVIREELASAKGKTKPKAEFVELGRFNTGQNTQIRVSVAAGDGDQPILGLAKVHGDFVEKQFGFRLSRELADALLQLVTKFYPDLTVANRKRGRGA